MNRSQDTAVSKVSIVMTAYNAERYIKTSVEAALAQTYSNFEVLVLNDGSTDHTHEICQSIHDSRLRYLSRGRLGRPRALNEGIASASGEYIAINDADDVSLPHRLSYTMEFLRAHNEIAFVGTNFFRTEEFQDRIPEDLLSQPLMTDGGVPVWPSRTMMFRRNAFNNSTLIYPKTTWARVGGYDETLTITEDYDFYLRALQCGPAVLLPGRTVLWFTNPNGFFKQKSSHENLRALRLIKRRAHRLLKLPGWLRWYQPLWEVGFRLGQQFPCVLDMVRGVRNSSAIR